MGGEVGEVGERVRVTRTDQAAGASRTVGISANSTNTVGKLQSRLKAEM